MYSNLFKNIKNWREYVLHKSEHKKRPLTFTTKPNEITFTVKGIEYLIFKELFLHDFYEVDRLVADLPQNPVVIDIGANIGLFPVLLLSKVPTATIYSYEPLPRNVKKINEIIECNPELKNKVNVYQKAVTGNHQESIDIYFDNNNDGTAFASAYATFDARNSNKITVPSTTLESIIDELSLSKIDILKLDCEGSEYPILYNLREEYFSKLPSIFVEVHEMDNSTYNSNAMRDFLTAKGYTTTTKITGTDCSMIWAKRA